MVPSSVPSQPDPGRDTESRRIREALGSRSLVLVGMMGAGKSSVGRRLANRLGLPFSDADTEIERASQMTIPEFFAARGEAEFREGEKRVIARLLAEGPRVIATGGGAYMNGDTRARIATSGFAVWLKAEFDVLMRRVRKRSNRPLLQNPDPEGTLRRLMDLRYPTYALADLTVMSRDVPHETVVSEIMAALPDLLSRRDEAPPAPPAAGPAEPGRAERGPAEKGPGEPGPVQP